MKAFLSVVALLSLISLAGGQGVMCPIPDSGTPPTETECGEYSACEWSVTQCVLKDNSLAGYTVISDRVTTGMGYIVYLTKTDPTLSVYGSAIMNITVDVMYHQNNHVHVRLTDTNNGRYQVPIPLIMGAVDPDPDVEIIVSDKGSPFQLNITRKSTGKNVYQTVGPLIYEDQFLEITTALTSEYLYGMGDGNHQTLKHQFDPRVTQAIWGRDQPSTSEPVNQYGSHPNYVHIEDDAGNTHSVLYYSSNAMEYSTFLLSDSTPAITTRSIGGVIDLHMNMGPTPEDVNRQYYDLVGRPFLPPYWMMGFILSRWGYDSTDNYRAVRDRMRTAGMPQDVQMFDIDYMSQYRDFTVNEDGWTDFASLIQELHDENIKVIVILDPAIVIDMSYPIYAKGKETDVFMKWANPALVPSDQPADAADYVVGYVWPGNKTAFPDFWKPATKVWWKNQLMELQAAYPFDGVWIDMNEPANFGTDLDRPWNYPEGEADWSLKCPDNSRDSPPYPTRAATMAMNEPKRLSDKTLCLSTVNSDDTNSYSFYDTHNLYGYSETVATQEALEAIWPGTRQVILSRSTFVGSGQKAIHWLGDNDATWEQMATSIVGMIEFNMFGMPMVGADVCGFFNEPTEELCIRWMQLGAFSPFDRNHNTNGTADQDPAKPEWTKSQTMSRDVLLLRYKHIPYFFTKMHRATMHSEVVIRAMFHNFPTDLKCRTIQDQFMWATEMMVAPILTEGAVQRDIYFPADALWYSPADGSLVSAGGETLTVDAALDEIPFYYRGGGIIPTTKPEVTTVLSRQNNYNLTVSLDSNLFAVGQLYVSDPDNNMYMPDTYLADFEFDVTLFQMAIQHNVTILSGYLTETVTINGYPSAPSIITYNGVDMDTSLWNYSDSLKVVDISLKHDMTKPFNIVFS